MGERAYEKLLTTTLAILSLLFLSHIAVQAQDKSQQKAIPAVQLLLLSEEQTGPTYTITSSRVDIDGTITPFGAVTVLQGASPSFVIQANAGYILEELNVDFTTTFPKVTNYTYTFTNVQANHTIRVHFHPI